MSSAKKLYRRLAGAFHPDRPHGSHALMQEINAIKNDYVALKQIAERYKTQLAAADEPETAVFENCFNNKVFSECYSNFCAVALTPPPFLLEPCLLGFAYSKDITPLRPYWCEWTDVPTGIKYFCQLAGEVPCALNMPLAPYDFYNELLLTQAITYCKNYSAQRLAADLLTAARKFAPPVNPVPSAPT